MNTNGLLKITGTEEINGLVKLISGKVSGNPIFINSFSRHPYNQKEISANGYFSQGEYFRVTTTRMPKDFLDQTPCCNSGGKIMHVVKGEYFDADMNGNQMREYPEGSTVLYSAGSTHRQLSRFGAEMICVSFDRIISEKRAEDLIKKMSEARISDKAIEYAMRWMIANEEERRELRRMLSSS